ncbi:MAG: subclass B3 metallo-beta-lactamase [Chitinophagaceae bacterium]|nr:subclass B3 metallo-beta-lactamase [Chitinophagaceae bacterium]
MLRNILLISSLLFSGIPSYSQAKEPPVTNTAWTQPYPAFRIAGNLYYVGTYDLGCYLITSSKGHILINTGTAASLKQIQSGIRDLGFKLKDIRILLTTQVHYDHVGAMAKLKLLTGAKMLVNQKDSGVLADGGRSDYELGKLGTSFHPVKPDGVLKDGDSIRLGDIKMVILHHPGHTKGSASYLLEVKDENRNYRVLIANMPTIISDRKFSDIHSYPGIATDFAYTLKSMKGLQFDLWVASHASQFGLHSKHKPGDAYDPQAFADRQGYDDELRELQESYDKKMNGRSGTAAYSPSTFSYL